MIDDRDGQRYHVASKVRKLATRCACGRPGSLPLLYGGGQAPSIMGLLDDTVGSLMRKAVKLGGSAYVMVVDELAGDEVRLRVLRIERHSTPITELDGQSSGRVNEDSTLGTALRGMAVGEQHNFYSCESEIVIRFLADSVQPVLSGLRGKPTGVSEAGGR